MTTVYNRYPKKEMKVCQVTERKYIDKRRGARHIRKRDSTRDPVQSKQIRDVCTGEMRGGGGGGVSQSVWGLAPVHLEVRKKGMCFSVKRGKQEMRDRMTLWERDRKQEL